MVGRPSQNMDALWAEVVRIYRKDQTACRQSSLGLSPCTDPARLAAEHPKLKGRAAEVKSLAPVVLEAWRQRQRPGVQEDAWVAGCLEALCDAQGVLDETPHEAFLEPARAAAFRRHLDEYLRLYSRLAAAAVQAGDLLWTVAPKFHALWHLGEKAESLNPRRGACFLDEDFMRRLKAIAQRCTASTPLHNIPAAILDKYRWGMWFQHAQAGEA